jgi:hypothetical protein
VHNIASSFDDVYVMQVLKNIQKLSGISENVIEKYKK